MKNRRNYYRILHVQRDAPTEVIRSSYRTMMQRLKMHPDLGGDDANAALINEAYAVLTDSVRRAEYDAGLLPVGRGEGATPGSRSEREAQQEPAPEARPESKPEPEPASWRADAESPAPRARCAFCQAPCRDSDLVSPDDTCAVCASPLFPAVRLRLEEESRRAVERVATREAARFWTEWPQSAGSRGKIEDVSLGGAQLQTGFALTPGQTIKVVTTLFEAVATVVDCRRAGTAPDIRYRIGLKFETLVLLRSRGAFVSIDA